MSNPSIVPKLAPAPSSPSDLTPRRAPKRSILPFLLLWIVLIGGGVAGTYWYTDHMKQQIESELQLQTAKQIAAMQQDYRNRLDELKASYEEEMAKMSSKVDALNELLTFNQDNVNDKTDNSNKLYTQISELKKQMDELKKNLDVLK
ncbi:hypothetical protein [Cohnella thailandensis]|uniref:hypothetical protein n=1 Tax=Cohnella thailandensis TaxID=557557 RepID=UPI001D3C2ED2|nr:hypothetical protein [Cohnella thailandensis]MBP1972532.1 uncharacterized protein YukE [Cohnella thailandensis]